MTVFIAEGSIPAQFLELQEVEGRRGGQSEAHSEAPCLASDPLPPNWTTVRLPVFIFQCLICSVEGGNGAELVMGMTPTPLHINRTIHFNWS